MSAQRLISSIVVKNFLIMLQEKLGEFGLSVEDLVGLTSDGAATMVACGRLMEVIHQLCLGTLNV